MTHDRVSDVLRVCQEALAREGAARTAYLDAACGADTDLRRDVEALLAEPSASGPGFLDTPPWAPTAPALVVGQRLGAYEVTGRLGAGGMGEVYKARDTRLGRTVAIKVLPAGVAADPGRRRRFEQEARAVSALNHPHICVLHDIGTTSSPQAAGGATIDYLVMEYVEGQTLADRLTKGPLPLEQALTVATEIAQALAAAHRQGVIHRDLKPGNVMLTKAGSKLLDFGLAKLKGHGEQPAAGHLASTGTASTPLTGEGVILGTLPYVAPEQVEGRETDARTDLFALGCVLYEMLTGRRAFAGQTEASLITAIMASEPPPVRSLQPATPPALERIVTKCLAKDPETRWQSAADLVDELTWVARDRAGWRRRRTVVAGAAIAVVVAALVGVVWYARPRLPPSARQAAASSPAPTHARTSIAVLPFQNLSAGGPHAYFAGGLHDELLTQLAKVASLNPISRTSVMGYQGTTKPPAQIAAELGVGTIVEGTVQVTGERLRVTVHLIDVATNRHLWAERYDRTLDDAFAIESDVAQQIVAAVGAALSSVEQGRLAATPTASAEAYRLYLQGREYYVRPGVLPKNLETARQLYERALGVDPDFALAHAALSEVYGRTYWFRYDPAPQRAARQREEAEAALRLAPDLPQAHSAMGLTYYFSSGDYNRALEEFTITLKGLPNDAELVRRIGWVHARLGHWDQIFAAFDKATQLNPRDADLFLDLGRAYITVRRYADAVRAEERALRLAPNLHAAARDRGWVYVLWRGQLDVLRDVLNGLPNEADVGWGLGSAAPVRAELLLLERNADGLLQMPEVKRGTVFDDQTDFLPGALYAAWAHELRGDGAAARAAYDTARARLDAAMKDLPGDWRVHAARGQAMAGLGRRDEALREARWLQESELYRGDAVFGPFLGEERALILARAGDTTAALDEIERLLSRPGWVSVWLLRLDPRWDPIRNDPRFKALLAKYSAGEAR